MRATRYQASGAVKRVDIASWVSVRPFGVSGAITYQCNRCGAGGEAEFPLEVDNSRQLGFFAERHARCMQLRNRIAIVGARPPQGDPPAPEALEEWLCILADFYRECKRLLVEDEPTLVVSGGALGIDEYAHAMTKRVNLCPITVFLPDYDKYSARVAPLERNKLIAANCDTMHAWPASWSTGTHHATNHAKQLGKNVIEHRPWEHLAETF